MARSTSGRPKPIVTICEIASWASAPMVNAEGSPKAADWPPACGCVAPAAGDGVAGAAGVEIAGGAGGAGAGAAGVDTGALAAGVEGAREEAEEDAAGLGP